MRKTPVSHIQRDAVSVILSRVSQILQAVAVQVEHAQLQLGFPNPTIDSACEEEATSLICCNDEILGFCVDQQKADEIVESLRSEDTRLFFHWHQVGVLQ